MLDIIIWKVIAGVEYPFIGVSAMLHTIAVRDTLHINARGVA
jgi:hypothetical protein